MKRYEDIISALWGTSALGDFEAQFGDSLQRPDKCRTCTASLKNAVGKAFQAPERKAKFIPTLSVTCSENCFKALKERNDKEAPLRVGAFLAKLPEQDKAKYLRK